MRWNRYRADDGFNWKLSVALYLSLEAFVVGLLRPRVYKKNGDIQWSKSCSAVSGIWPISLEIYCSTPILATHPQGHIGPCVGPNPRLRLPNVRLGVGEPPHGVGDGGEVAWRGLV